jgi:hypothetical protein
LAYWFQRRRFLNIFPIGSYVKTMSADGADILKRAYLCQVSDTGSHEPLVLNVFKKSLKLYPSSSVTFFKGCVL